MEINAVLTTPAPGNDVTGNPTTIAIVNEFVSIIDMNKEYTIKELNSVLTDVYKTKMGTAKATAKKGKKSSKKKDSDNDDSDEEPKKRVYKKKDENKPKKKPTAYNMFMKERMLELKETQPDGKLRMAEAASGWKNLSDEEKSRYKPKEDEEASE
jgi:hypothetical protein